MAKRLVVDLFCEDSGHESFARALIRRLAEERGSLAPDLRARSARGGHGRAITELRAWQRSGLVERGDLLLVLIDGNGEGWHEQRKRVEAEIDVGLFPLHAVGCPDPHVEAWCAADPAALTDALGVALPDPPRAGKLDYKRWLRRGLEDAGYPVLGDPMDVIYQVMPSIDLYRAGKHSPSLKAFVDQVRALLAMH